MRRKTAGVILVVAFSLAIFFVPAIPLTFHTPPALNPPHTGPSTTIYRSVSVYYFGVGAVYGGCGAMTGAYRLVDFRMGITFC